MNYSLLSFSIVSVITVFFLPSCSLNDDINNTVKSETAIEISGGPYTFTIDNTPDFISGLEIVKDNTSLGSQVAWIVTESNGNILSIHSTKDDLESTNFNDAGIGNCLIWWLRYNPELKGLSINNNINTDLQGTFRLSNSIVINRTTSS